ncbi:MAG: hypothetical protein WEC33_04745 [Dehalococcoidia bacterium]
MDPIVRKVDHVLVRVDDSEKLWEVFVGPLQLPVAWPPFEYEGFRSAAFCLGEVNVELLTPAAGSQVPQFAEQPGARLIGVAFEPFEVAAAAAGLDARGIPHREPWSYEHKVGEMVVASWTSLDLEPGWLPGSPITLFVKYDRDQDANWDRQLAALARVDGGPLGVEGLGEVVPGAGKEGQAQWASLLDGVATASGRRRAFERGPAIALSTATTGDLAIDVADMDRASTMAAQLGLIGRSTARGLSLAFEGVALPFRLREVE